MTLAAAEMIKSGTTCFNDMYHFPESAAEAVERCGMRAVIGLMMIEFPTPHVDAVLAHSLYAHTARGS